MHRMKTCQGAQASGILLFFLVIFTHVAFSQSVDNTQSTYHIGAGATVTNTGISLIPSFSLGKPAAMFDLSVGKGKLSFDPQLRFALTGKPWSFLFWWRYKLLKTDRFSLSVGAHPAFVYRTILVTYNGVNRDVLNCDRYLAEEISPNYLIAKNISIGMYYIHSNGLNEGTTKTTHFVTINSNFTDIKLSKQFYMKFNPQLYYLKMDALDGFYATATTTLARRHFPLSLQSILNHAIKTKIPASKSFLWNVSLVYSFRNEYARK